jgi:hypothetical protein
MSRCPFCDTILPDAWVKKQGATLMGKASGQAKARSSAKARAAAEIGWKKRRKAKRKKK